MPVKPAEKVSLLLTHSIGCTATFTQVAGLAALLGDQSMAVAQVDEYQRRRDRLVAGLNAIPGISCRLPQGAFYAFPNIRGTGLKSRDLADLLLEQAGVAVLPGTDFGQFGEGYLRLCYANSMENIELALERIAKVFS